VTSPIVGMMADISSVFRSSNVVLQADRSAFLIDGIRFSKIRFPESSVFVFG